VAHILEGTVDLLTCADDAVGVDVTVEADEGLEEYEEAEEGADLAGALEDELSPGAGFGASCELGPLWHGEGLWGDGMGKGLWDEGG
jgi:hypothetical protein